MRIYLQTRRQEIDSLKTKVEELIGVGHELVQSSSRVRANDIESHLSRLSEFWSRVDHKAKAR